MRLSRARVCRYRSIIDTGWVNIEDDITTLLGKNESGKSSFLKAIASLSSDREYTNREIHYDVRDHKDRIPIVSLDIGAEGSFAENIYDKLSIDKRERVILVKYSDGERAIEVGDETINLGADYEYKDQYESLLESIIERLDTLRNQNTGQFRSQYDNNAKNEIESLKDVEDCEPESLVKNFEQLRTIIQKLPEQNDNITQKKNGILDDIDYYLDEFEENLSSCVHPDDIFPAVIYHDEFDTIDDSVTISELESGNHRTFENLLSIIGVSIDEFGDLDNIERIQRLDDAEGVITGEVNEIWEQKSIEVDIDYTENRFTVLVKDTKFQIKKAQTGKKRLIGV